MCTSGQHAFIVRDDAAWHLTGLLAASNILYPSGQSKQAMKTRQDHVFFMAAIARLFSMLSLCIRVDLDYRQASQAAVVGWQSQGVDQHRAEPTSFSDG